jgi:sensor histidine kinase YesM
MTKYSTEDVGVGTVCMYINLILVIVICVDSVFIFVLFFFFFFFFLLVLLQMLFTHDEVEGGGEERKTDRETGREGDSQKSE